MDRGELKYQARHALVRVKQVFGLSTRPDKTFFVERLSRLIRSGEVSRRCRVIALGKDDGAGSQAQCEMSAMSFAAAHGIGHVHRPFGSIEHVEAGVEDWVGTWERYFNLGEGFPTLAELDLVVVPIERFVRRPELWQSDVVVSAEHFLHFTKLEPAAWLAIREIIHARYRSYEPRPSAGGPVIVALHVRRGDVSTASKTTAGNYTPNEAFMTTLRLIDEALRRVGRDYTLELHSQGSPELFADFERRGCRLFLDTSAIETHKRLVNADVLVMSQSAFSFTAGLLNRGVSLYDPHKYPPMPGWVLRERSGAFDLDGFVAALEAKADAAV